MNNTGWLLEGAIKDDQSVTPHWQPVQQQLIHGVVVKEVLHLLPAGGIMTELYRKDWNTDAEDVDHVFARTLDPGANSAWHAHALTRDRLFVLQGAARIVLYDSRPESPTCGAINQFRVGALRPTLITVPQKVWHAVQNIGPDTVLVVNMVSRAYQYADPDHYRLPADTPAIPFKF